MKPKGSISLDVREQRVNLANFLTRRIDHNKLWEAFDTDHNGYLDEKEFKDLLLQTFVYFVEMQAETEQEDIIMPEKYELMNSVNILYEQLANKIDKNRDGTIDFEEFRNLGDYMMSEYQKIHDKDFSNNGEFSMAHMAQQMFGELEELEDEQYIDESLTKITYFGPPGMQQIVQYDSEGLKSMKFWTYGTGTVVGSLELWGKELFLTILVGVGFLISHFGLGDYQRELNTLELRSFLVGIETLLAFLAGFYVEGVLGRWWTMRSDGIGGVINSLNDLCLVICSIMHENTKKQKDIRNLIMRYGLLSHALLYDTVKGNFITEEDEAKTWEKLMSRSLVFPSEVKILKGQSKKFPVVWSWIMSYIRELHSQGILGEVDGFGADRRGHMIDICREARRAGSCTLLHQSHQLPLPYVHLVCFIVNAYQVTCFSY